jgi:hypothetical protein
MSGDLLAARSLLAATPELADCVPRELVPEPSVSIAGWQQERQAGPDALPHLFGMGSRQVISASTDVQPDQRQQEFIAAIHAIVNADRLLTEQELLTTTACELLVEGALGTDELTRQINEIWAGANIPQAPIESALQTAVEAGLMISTPTGSGIVWSLTPAGRAGAGGARDWTENAYARTTRQLQDLAAKDFRPVGDVEARLWVDLLAQALSDGIREAYAAFIGDVTLLVDGSLTPGIRQRSGARSVAGGESSRNRTCVCGRPSRPAVICRSGMQPPPRRKSRFS